MNKKTKNWICNNCKYIHSGDRPPKGCPKCGASGEEFDLMPLESVQERAKKIKPADFILINGSAHRSHNTRFILDVAAGVFREQKKSFQIINISEWRIDPCWCCYSMRESLCQMPCRNDEDDMKYFYPLLLNCKGIIIATPINWNNMAAKLKSFLDRLTAIQNMFLIKKETPMLGKIYGIIVNGHEDGAYKTAFDIAMYGENLGMVMAPFGIAYTTHGRNFKPEEDNKYFRADERTQEFVRAVANNVIKFSEIKFDYKKIIPAAE